MGLKGRIAWAIAAEKVNMDAFRALYFPVVNDILERCGGDVEKANREIWELGRRMGTLLLERYMERLRKLSPTFFTLYKTYNLAYKFFIGREWSNILVIKEQNKIVFEDFNCPICKGVSLEEPLKGLKYCNIIGGIYTYAAQARGFNAECHEVLCKAGNHECCRYELTLKD